MTAIPEPFRNRPAASRPVQITRQITGGGGATTGFPILIWAEENSNLSSGTAGGFQWSWGNGGTGSGNRVVIPVDCELTALGLNTEASTTGTVEFYIDGVATGATVSIASSTNNTATIDPAVSVPSGSRVEFRTTSGSGGSGCVASALLRTT